MVVALRIACHVNKFKCDEKVEEIRSDSDLLCKYWSKGRYSKKLSKEKIQWIITCSELCEKFSGSVIKIPAKENLADLFNSH